MIRETQLKLGVNSNHLAGQTSPGETPTQMRFTAGINVPLYVCQAETFQPEQTILVWFFFNLVSIVSHVVERKTLHL